MSLQGLGEFVTVIDAPLTDLTIEGERYRSHEIRALDGLTSIDLVLDDGPPLYLGKGLRRAGLPALRSKLRSGGIYLLNFIAAEERRAVTEWLRRYADLQAETLRTQKGNVVLRRPQQRS